jgi:hypothetical protein
VRKRSRARRSSMPGVSILGVLTGSVSRLVEG